MGNETYHVISHRSSRILRAAAREIAKLKRFEFAVGDEYSGLALSQLRGYLLRISEGLPPFAIGARRFVNALLRDARRERLRQARVRPRQAA